MAPEDHKKYLQLKMQPTATLFNQQHFEFIMEMWIKIIMMDNDNEAAYQIFMTSWAALCDNLDRDAMMVFYGENVDRWREELMQLQTELQNDETASTTEQVAG